MGLEKWPFQSRIEPNLNAYYILMKDYKDERVVTGLGHFQTTLDTDQTAWAEPFQTGHDSNICPFEIISDHTHIQHIPKA